ncbi:MAG: PAS domain S-box protein [Desulfarculaceae bacterium]|nr:PAS domain S-box protein [Desulfarculaceae bacterium]
MEMDETPGENTAEEKNAVPQPLDGADNDSPARPGFPVVGIGASAGGLEALQAFFKHLPENLGAAYVIIQHLSPDYKSLMDELLARTTDLPIHIASDSMQVKPDEIYLIPPRHNMTIYRDKLFLTPQRDDRMLNLPIDIFLRSLAKDKEKDAVGIILSGTGTDGTLGIRAVKEFGGMVMAQDSDSAKFDGMPQSAVSTGIVDYILAPEKMPVELKNYFKHPFIRKVEDIEVEISKDKDYLSKIISIIRDKKGTDFYHYKHTTIVRRLEKRISINQFVSLDDYVHFLEHDPNEVNLLYKELLIGVTSFFREKEAYGQLKEKVLPKIFQSDGKQRPKVRIWGIGCSTGEEAYSTAILCKEYMEAENVSADIKIFATDIDYESIEVAGAGIYPDSIASDVSAERLGKYFTTTDKGLQVNEAIRRMVVFARHDILQDPPFSKIDLISCRNMLIYFTPEAQQKVLAKLYYSLQDKGFLFLGSSESIGNLSNGFSSLDQKWRIYQSVPGQRSFMKDPILMATDLHKGLKDNRRRMPEVRSPSRGGFSQAMLEDLVGGFVPPSVVIDSNYDIVYTLHDLSRYLKIPSGKMSVNIMEMLPDDLTVALRSLLRRARKEKEGVSFTNISPQTDPDNKIDLNVRMAEDPKTQTVNYLVSFIPHDRPDSGTESTVEVEDFDSRYQERIVELEKELQVKQESLQATVEELETSNEELQTSNEELVASNEELQSTNEELQSVNEELYTINSEYQEKIQELSELNNDMTNLLLNTGIGALFLDRKKRIRKFTRVAGRLTSIREGDIGRPIQDLATAKIYTGFDEDIEEVFATLATVEREMQDPNGNWYMVRMLPYRTEENAVDGVIVTFINITSLKETEAKAEELHDRLEKALDVGELVWWDWDLTTGRMAFSSRIEQVSGIDSRQIGQTCEEYRSLIHPEDTSRVKSLVNDMLNNGSKVYDVKYRLKNRDGDYVWVRDRGGVVRRNGQGDIQEAAGILANISREKQLEIERDKSYELIYKSMDYSPVAKTVVDRDGVITFANKQARKMLQITESEITNRTYDDGRWRITSGDGKLIPAEDLPFSRVMETGEPVYDFRHYIQVNDHTPILLSISGAPIFDDSGRVLSVVFTLDDITAKTERENAIRESEEQYRRLFDCNMDAILVADTERRIMDANPAFEKLFGYTLDELKGRNTRDIYAEQQEHVRMGESLQQQNPEGGFIKIVQYKKKDETVFPGETSAFHLKDSNGDVRAFVGLIREKQEVR